MTSISLAVICLPEHAGKRLDQVAAKLIPAYSRSKIKQWIESGELLVDGEQATPKQKVRGDEQITLDAKLEIQSKDVPEAIEFEVVYEDEHLIVVNKPAGLVVHPGNGHAAGTLVNGLLNRYPELGELPRAGIVHRLDKDTTGLMLVGRHLASLTALSELLKDRLIDRRYFVILNGVMTASQRVDVSIGRHPTTRTKMAAMEVGHAKPASTYFKVLQRFDKHTFCEAKLETGRTHQIRVHAAHMRYPVFGDQLYGGRLLMPGNLPEEAITFLQSFKRQALHAHQLSLAHPITGDRLTLEAPLPDDIAKVLAILSSSD